MKLIENKALRGFLLVFFTALVVAMTTSVYGDFTRDRDGDRDKAYESLRLFTDVLQEIERNYVESVETSELIEKAIHGLMEELDPHSALLPPDVFKGLQDDTRGEFGGIGIVISKKDGELTVVSPMEGTPAFKAGIQANDVIVKVDDQSTKDMLLWEAVSLMRGEPGTPVIITVRREGKSETLVFELERQIIPLESVRYATLKPGYGYLWITNFREKTTDEARKAINSLKYENNGALKGLILDLRDNPGGLLNQAISISDLFLENGEIVSIRGRGDREMESYRSTRPSGRNQKFDFPVVILINSGSASAAEIVAGALRDNERALVVGTSSFGKGSVQTVKPLRGGYALKYTIANYYTPSGKSITAEGIQPDLVVERELLDESKIAVGLRQLREKDLEDQLQGMNNREADKKNEEAESERKEEMEKLMRLRDVLYDHDDRDPSVLLLDSQVNRAYEVLKGEEDLFSFMKNR